MNPEDHDEVVVRIESRYELNGKTLGYTTCFYPDRLVVLYKDRKVSEIPYKDIARVTKNRGGLTFSLEDGSCMKIPCMGEERREIFGIFRMKRMGIMRLSAENIVGAALVEFANLQFLVPLESSSFVEFKKRAIKRIGGYFFPSKDLDFVSLEHYDELAFYIRKGESFVILDSDDDLACAFVYFGKRLDVLVRKVVKE